MQLEQDLKQVKIGNFTIPYTWEGLSHSKLSNNDSKYIAILEEHGFRDLPIHVPLVGRYTKGRRWTKEEFGACYTAWKHGISLTLISAALNRNPQDMIYKLLDQCQKEGIEFTQRGRSEGSKNWTKKVSQCAEQLFAAGLPAWKIAVLFKVDFEYVEKALFLGRSDYGHAKKNPFGINTEHKHFCNRSVLEHSKVKIDTALDAFAGEGVGTEIIRAMFPAAKIIAVEVDPLTFANAQQKVWSANVEWINKNNIQVFEHFASERKTFDFVDLDPFVTCHEQIPFVWDILSERALLFITFGGEYRRSFIRTNRKAIAKRYGFYNETLDNRSYLEIVPKYFLGWVALQASKHGFIFDVIRAVRYANNCRLWLKTNAVGHDQAIRWFSTVASEQGGGWRFENLQMPRFREVRHELEHRQQMELFR